MCECGTTLVEALLHNRNAIGNDLNPLAALISRVKTTLIKEEEFRHLNSKLEGLTREADVQAISQVLLEIKQEGHERLYDFGRVALSASIWSNSGGRNLF